MTGRLIRSKISEQVAEMVGSRQGRELLEQHGWVRGMPIVLAQPDEKLSDAMALVGVHEPPVLLATMTHTTEELCFMHVSRDCYALEVVPAQGPETTVWQLYAEARERECFHTFRVENHTYSSVIHAMPPVRPAVSNFGSLRIPAARGA